MRKNLHFISDLILFLVAFISLTLFRIDIVVLVFYLIMFPYLVLTRRTNLLYHFLIATGVAFIWILIAGSHYGYNQETMSVFGTTIYPFFAWSLGLFGAYLLFRPIRMRGWNFAFQLLVFFFLYAGVLLTLETFAFQVFDIRNIATGMYPGLPVCDCIHAPRWMQFVYLLMGPTYYSICHFLKLD